MIQFNNTLSYAETATAIAAIGHKRTVYVEGDMGSGKTSLMKELCRMFPDHIPVTIDGTRMEIGDLVVPMFDKIDDAGIVTYAINEAFGVHLNKPMIINIDEIAKAPRPVQNALMEVILERSLAGRKCTEGTIVFLTGNLSSEGVGDHLAAHHLNRIVRVRMRKATSPEWVEDFARPNGIHNVIIGFVQEEPRLGESFTDVDLRMGDTSRLSADEYKVKLDELNPYIYHPKAVGRNGFWTWRSAEAASDILWQELPRSITTQLLIGTIGERATRDLQAFMDLADDLPKMSEVYSDPLNAKLPHTAAAQVMVVDKALATIDFQTIDNWITYMERLPRELQAIFVNTTRKSNYTKSEIVHNSAAYRDWCTKNHMLYSKDVA